MNRLRRVESIKATLDLDIEVSEALLQSATRHGTLMRKGTAPPWVSLFYVLVVRCDIGAFPRPTNRRTTCCTTSATRRPWRRWVRSCSPA